MKRKRRVRVDHGELRDVIDKCNTALSEALEQLVRLGRKVSNLRERMKWAHRRLAQLDNETVDLGPFDL